MSVFRFDRLIEDNRDLQTEGVLRILGSETLLKMFETSGGEKEKRRVVCRDGNEEFDSLSPSIYH